MAMILIGERINGSFKDVLKAVQEKDPGVIQGWVAKQESAGADYLDVNMGTASRDPEDFAWLVRVAAESDSPLVPSGGRTGLSGGATAPNGEVVVSFDRMRRILDFNAVERTLTVEPGVVTAEVQRFAEEQGLYYPVSFAAEGSSQMGGNIATNAGGIRVLRYGLTRERVAGLKVVDGRGELLDCNRGLVKNASGYDLRHLFIGSEGTLGFIVEATLRLIDPPLPSRVMLLGLETMEGVMTAYDSFQSALDLTAFEFLDDRSLFHTRDAHGLAQPLEGEYPLYVITEFDCPNEDQEKTALDCFEAGFEAGWLKDGVISQSVQQAADLWLYREGTAEAAARYAPYKNDLSVTISRVPGFIGRVLEELRRICPEFDVLVYGHIGDGNVHINLLRPDSESEDDFHARCVEITNVLSELAGGMGGSASAEHGIGTIKKPWLSTTRSPAEIDHMRGIKKVFDPAGILNPGKLLA